MKECGARKKDGTPCRAAPMQNGRCRIHGGKTPTGMALPQYKDGRYSRYLPARLAGRYAEAQADGALLELRDDIALVDSRLADLLGRVDSGESGALWQSLMAARSDLLAYRRAGDNVRMAEALNLILELIGQGHADYRAWGEVAQVLEQRRRLVESERKRLIELQQTITVEKAMLLIGAIGGIIKAHVQEREVLAKISAEITALVQSEGRPV